MRILVVGDSTAMATGAGVVEWAALHPEYAQVSVAASPGCGFVRGTIIEPLDQNSPFQRRCEELLDHDVPHSVATLGPDVVVLMVTMRDLENRAWSGDEGVLTPFDPRYEQRELDSYRDLAASLRARGVPRIVWILAPRPEGAFPPERSHMADPARYDVQRRVILRVAAENPDLVRTVDVDGWMEERGMIRDFDLRPDGFHFAGPALARAQRADARPVDPRRRSCSDTPAARARVLSVLPVCPSGAACVRVTTSVAGELLVLAGLRRLGAGAGGALLQHP